MFKKLKSGNFDIFIYLIVTFTNNITTGECTILGYILPDFAKYHRHTDTNTKQYLFTLFV